MDVGNEFRGFACNGVLTAITQYNNLCFYPHLQGIEVWKKKIKEEETKRKKKRESREEKRIKEMGRG